jgi:hypothetical protein
MRLTLLQDVNAFSSKNKVDSREALRRITLGLVCVHDFQQRSNQTVGTVLMLEPLEGERVMSKNTIGLKTQVLEGLLEETLGQRYRAIF